jgi:O-antigen/teichoic acid export membrane protein
VEIAGAGRTSPCAVSYLEKPNSVKQDDLRKGFAGAVYNYLGMFFEKLVTVLVTIYVIRQLPIPDFGVFNLFQDTIGLVAVIFSFGIPSLIERFLPELYQRGLFDELRRWVYRALIARFLLGLLGALVCLFGRDAIGGFLHSDLFTAYYPVFAFGLLFTILNQTSQSVLDTFLMQKRRNVIRVIVSALRAGLYMAAISLGQGLYGILWAFSISALVGSVLFIHTIYRLRYPQYVEKKTEGLGDLSNRFRRYGAISYLNEMGAMVLSRRADNYLISAFLNPAAVGIYSFATRIVEMFVAMTPLVVGNVIISTLLFRQFTETPTLIFLQRRFNLLCKLALYLTLPILIVLVGLHEQITVMVDPKYHEASYLLALVAIFEILNVFSWPIGWMAQTSEKVEVQLYSKIGAIYNIIAAVILIPRFGPLGAAWATGTSFLMKNILMYVFLRRQLPLTFPWLGIFKLGLSGFLSWIVLALLAEYATRIIPALAIAVLGMVVFAISAKLLVPFDEDERESFEKAVGRKIWLV